MQCSARCGSCFRCALHGAYGLHAASCGAAADFPDGRACDGDGHRARARPRRLAACDACARPLHYDAAALALAAELGGGEPTHAVQRSRLYGTAHSVHRRIGAAESPPSCAGPLHALHANTSAQRGLCCRLVTAHVCHRQSSNGLPPLFAWLAVRRAVARRSCVTAVGCVAKCAGGRAGCIRHRCTLSVLLGSRRCVQLAAAREDGAYSVYRGSTDDRCRFG